MKVVLKTGKLVLIPETPTETADLAAWKSEQAGRVFLLQQTTGSGQALIDLGPRAEVCQEPINVTSLSQNPAIQLISNFAATPFLLDGREYASVESFWQGLKFPKSADRRRIAELPGKQARREGEHQGYEVTIAYEGETIVVGTWAHWQLMQRACQAKFDQNDEARAALLSTGSRPLIHRVRRDSRTIPGVIMADIWMRIRAQLNRTIGPVEEEQEGEE
jgi:predicted NAD-dependent protein-ADP-ribosyltransferase YbiA (DUF1768 family)